MKNMNKMLKQAQKMQANLMSAQDELNNTEFEATVGGGTVRVVLMGDQKMKSIKIDPEVANDDVEMLEDMIVAAVNKAQEDIKNSMQNQMSKFTGGMNIPGLM